jgi:hypothetical protein
VLACLAGTCRALFLIGSFLRFLWEFFPTLLVNSFFALIIPKLDKIFLYLFLVR